MQNEFTLSIKKFIRKQHPLIKFYHWKLLKLLNEKNNESKINKSLYRLKKYKNLYDGKSCIIVGNGPSLKVEDLEKANNMISFASNKIQNIFGNTNWRPTYYCIADRKIYLDLYKNINEEIKNIFIQIDTLRKYPNFNENFAPYYIRLLDGTFYPSLPKFSNNILNGIYDGNTVTYMMLQIAIFMGFKTIYLLGIDHNYSQTLNPDGTVSYDSNIKDHFSDSDVIKNVPALYKSTIAYQAAKKYADEHGIKIYNATRGGKLEVFERIDFDSLFLENDKK